MAITRTEDRQLSDFHRQQFITIEKARARTKGRVISKQLLETALERLPPAQWRVYHTAVAYQFRNGYPPRYHYEIGGSIVVNELKMKGLLTGLMPIEFASSTTQLSQLKTWLIWELERDLARLESKRKTRHTYRTAEIRKQLEMLGE